MEKYDNDVEAKQAELDSLKSAKASDLTRLQELTQRYHEYGKVVQEDRDEKERLRKEAERELEEQKACVAIQAWWRGVMVRRQLGPYKPKKKGKGKGKKGGKGGKKKKKWTFIKDYICGDDFYMYIYIYVEKKKDKNFMKLSS